MEHHHTTSNMFKAEDVAEALREVERQRLEKLGEVPESIQPEQTPAQELEISFRKFVQQLFKRNHARNLAVALLCGSLANTLVLGIVDVIAVSGFVGDVGTINLPWLWAGELILSLVISGGLLQVIDNVPRVKMMRVLLVSLTLTYAALAGLFVLKISTGFLYPLMYLIYAQQAIIFPMAFWNVANTVYTLSDARKLFPILSSGELLGRLIGYSIFTLTGLLGYGEISKEIIKNPSTIMGLSSLLFLLGLLAFALIKETETGWKGEKRASFVSNLKNGFETIVHVPFFRNMSALVAVTWIALTILLFNFYTSIDTATSQGFHFQTIYSIYNISVLFLPLIFQWTIGDDLLKRISPKNGYLFLPFTLLFSMGLVLFSPSILSGIGAQFIAMVMYRGWYMPLYQSLYKLVPQENRGRVRSLLGNASYTLGSLAAALFIGGTLLILPLWKPDPDSIRTVYLIAALVATLAANFIAFRIRATYEDSLLSWRVARRTRSTELLERLEED